jgi:4-hydroxybenzoyl-CoA reductase subunit beta
VALGKEPTYASPDTIEAAWDLLRRRRGAVILAGGTDLVPRMKHRISSPSVLVDLRGIPGLARIEATESSILIGTMVTLDQLCGDEILARLVPALGSAARCVASPQIRNIGTIGGNILQERRCLYFNQSPEWRSNVASCYKLGGRVCHQAPGSRDCRALYYSDLAPVLLALDATAEVYEDEEPHWLPVGDLVRESTSARRKPVLVARFRIPGLPRGTWATFLKYSAREGFDFAILNAAMRYSPAGHGIDVPIVRIVAGAVSRGPIELAETAAFLAAHLTHQGDVREEVRARAERELKSHSAFIREPGVPLWEKRACLAFLGEALDVLTRRIEEMSPHPQ